MLIGQVDIPFINQEKNPMFQTDAWNNICVWFVITPEEMIELLDDYSVDELQIILFHKKHLACGGYISFSQRLIQIIKPYIVDRFKTEEGKHFPD